MKSKSFRFNILRNIPILLLFTLNFITYTSSCWELQFCEIKTLNRNLVLKNGRKLKTGEIMRNPELGKTLRIIRENPEDFYVGNLAKSIVADVNAEGGMETSFVLKNHRALYLLYHIGFSLSFFPGFRTFNFCYYPVCFSLLNWLGKIIKAKNIFKKIKNKK